MRRAVSVTHARAKRLAAAVTFGLLAVVVGLPAVHAANPTVSYVGRLTDAKRKPVAGIYPLTFSLFRSPKGGKSVWTESHFVAIDAGSYVVQLGATRKIPNSIDLSRVYISVALTGGDELLRERLDPKAIDEVLEPSGVNPTTPNLLKREGEAAVATGTVEYAETSGRAYLSDHAKTADRLGKLTEKELLEKLKEGGGKARIGTGVRYSPAAGGEGGTPFEIRCPPGTVVVGVKGAAGIYLDALQLICAAFE